MKKIVIAIMCMVLSMGFIACDSGRGKNGGTVKLKVWASSDQQVYISELVDKFKQNNTDTTYDIEVAVMAEPDCKAALQDINTAADLFAFPSDQIGEFRQKNYLYEVTINKDKIIADNLENSIRGATFNDKLYAYPVSESNTYFLYYDKSKLSASDVTSMEKIIARLALNGDGSQLYYDMGNAYYSVVYLFANGGYATQVLDGDATTNFDNDEGKAAVRSMISLANKAAATNSNVYLGDETSALALLGEGKIAAYISGTWRLKDMKEKYGENFEVAVLPTDKFDGVEKPLKAFMGCKYYAVNRYTQQPLAAMKLAEFLTGEEGQLARFRAIGEVPSNKAALALEEVQADKITKIIEAQRVNTVGQYDVPNFWAALGTFGGEIRDKGITLANYEVKLAELATRIRTKNF